jgi:hypothetical protein
MAEATTLPEVKEDKRDIIQAARELPNPPGGFSLRPRNFDEAYRFANLIASSDLVPKDFRDKPANVLVAVQLGMELNISPMQALQNIAVINGRPTIWGDLLPALIFSSGLLESLEETGDEKEARCTVKRKGFLPVTRTFSMDEARKVAYTEWIDNKKVQVTLADKQTYKSYPKRMLQMRARAFALRDMFPDVLKGLQVREEVEDFVEDAAPRDVTPPASPPQMKMPQPLPGAAKTETLIEGKANDTQSKSPTDDRRDGAPLGNAMPSAQQEGKHNETTSDQGHDTDAGGTIAIPAQPEEPKKSVKQIALAEIAGYSKDTFPEPAHLNPYLKGLKSSDALDITNAYMAKKTELGL